jgi:protein-S-isoprenylcysteine O-methyltransferase Ste14
MPSKSLLIRMVLQTAVSQAVIGAVLFLAAGDWSWPQGWAFLGEISAFSFVIGFWLAWHDPELLKARMTSPFSGGQRPADLALVIVIGVLFVAWLALMGLDAQRFMWTSAPLWARIVGAVVLGAGMVLCWETFRVNSFAAPQVRVQAERAQHVVSDGPYRYIRHPMYAGALLFFLGAPLILASLWGLAGGAILTLGLAVRAVGEEAVLRADLAGYEDYMKQVPWRIIPGIW